ncbi:MAG: nitrile hydratase subunit alpha [Pseudomonadota bacterium]
MHDHTPDHHHDHSHADGHDHHPPQPDHDAGPATPYEVLERALREVLQDKGVLTTEEVSAAIDIMDTRTPALGATVIARAWTDADFKAHLLADTRGALAEMDIDIGHVAEFQTIENTPKTHNVVVCTLCSCYPKMLLGLPPAWYKSVSYRSRVVREPRAVLQEFGLTIPDDREVRVHDSTADLRYLVLPMRPEGTDGWSAEQLAGTLTRDCMIGTALPSTEPR